MDKYVCVKGQTGQAREKEAPSGRSTLKTGSLIGLPKKAAGALPRHRGQKIELKTTKLTQIVDTRVAESLSDFSSAATSKGSILVLVRHEFNLPV